MAQFSLRRLLASVTLIAVGLASLAVLFNGVGYGWTPICLWIFGGALIMAGVFNMFRHPLAGVALGLIIQLILLTLYVARLRGGLGGG